MLVPTGLTIMWLCTAGESKMELNFGELGTVGVHLLVKMEHLELKEAKMFMELKVCAAGLIHLTLGLMMSAIKQSPVTLHLLSPLSITNYHNF